MKIIEGAIPMTGAATGEESTGQNMKFPWRSSNSIRFDAGLLDKIRALMAEGSFRQILRYDDMTASDDEMISSFLQGSVVAFAASAGSIFSLARHGAGAVSIKTKIAPSRPAVATPTEGVADTGTEAGAPAEVEPDTSSETADLAASLPDCSAQYAVSDLTEIFDPKLSTFYFDAIAAAKAAGLEVTYSLYSGASKLRPPAEGETEDCAYPITARISKHQVLFNAKREHASERRVSLRGEEEVAPRKEVIHYMGVFPFLVDDKSAHNALFPPTTEEEERAPKKMVVRVWVDVIVKELFYVKNKMTGALVQGSTEPVEAVHSLLLESQVVLDHVGDDRKVVLERSDWTVVDIDNWCNDNQFWR